MKFTSSVDEEIEGVIKRWAPQGKSDRKIPHDSIYIKVTIRQNLPKILYVKRDIFLGVEGCGDCEVYERGIWGAGDILSLDYSDY